MQIPPNLLYWLLFLAFVALMLVLDLGIFNRNAGAFSLRRALAWTTIWVALAAGFAVLLYFFGQRMTGHPAYAHANQRYSLEFVTGYLVEEALSVDNLFVFLLIFRHFKVPSELQRKVLFWGILGAILMRAVFIGAGVTLLNRFAWLTYLFGAFLLYAGIKLFFQPRKRPGDTLITRCAQRHLRLTDDFAGGTFTTMRNGVLWFTKLALVLIVIEATDVIFAVDSIPAVLAVTRQPYIVFTSNIFAILGLRSLYFALAGLMESFHLLHYGLAVILAFIGVKMLAANYFEIPTVYALGVIVAVLAASVALSLMTRSRMNVKSAE